MKSTLPQAEFLMHCKKILTNLNMIGELKEKDEEVNNWKQDIIIGLDNMEKTLKGRKKSK